MSATAQDPRTRQQSTSHILKTGKRGNPFVKDTHDLFSTLVASLQLTTNTRFFRSYPNSFTTDDAAANLSSLRFSQSNRSTDPNDPSRIVTTTTTTTFSMNRDIAKGICQHFMDARLIENAADPLNPTFKERGIYQITPKGLHVLERFITKNGIHADHLVRVFTTQPICMKLLHLERRPADDEIHITPNVINVVFKRFSGGRSPNYVCDPSELQRNTAVRPFTENPRLTPNYDRSLGVELQDVRERAASGTTLLVKHVFSSTTAIDWLVDFSTCCGREEAAELLAHFVRYGLITVHIDRSKGADKVAQVLVRAPSSEPTIPGVSLEGQFKYGAKVTYRITDEGRRLSGVDGSTDRAHYKLASGATNRTSEEDLQSVSHHHHQPHHPTLDQTVSMSGPLAGAEGQNDGRQVLRDILHADSSDGSAWVRDATSSSARLKAILGEPALRSLFRDFLRSHICEENLHYWIDVQEFRRRFATSSTAVGIGTAQNSKKKSSSSAATAMEQHQEKLVSTALLIFNTYLAPGSPSELNIDHNLRADVISYMSRAVDEAKGTPNSPDPSEGSVPALRATQVQALLRHYERIADHIYRLMATDQVPKFVRTERFLEILSAQQLDESRDNEGTTTMTSGYGTSEPILSIPSSTTNPSIHPSLPSASSSHNPGSPASSTSPHNPSSHSKPSPIIDRHLSTTTLVKHPSSYKKSTKPAPLDPSSSPTSSSSPTTTTTSTTTSPLRNHSSILTNPHTHNKKSNSNHTLTSFSSSSNSSSSSSSNLNHSSSNNNHHHNPSNHSHSLDPPAPPAPSSSTSASASNHHNGSSSLFKK
ncbi:hypothetical protein PGT21_016027 [Puccinia graminis f. sp. tritici]|uniref:RGS domain-containing protein n=2 Tax=Puccinia graminis f. sp. tritici TaxID=56615 RepID=E3KNZ4_PUCGT|nr:uncharacterized protein PGTG_11975 [Puccinia graminis f. sp. tritici CRL 75-36-700-3]EFP86019.2 hypothetical protein PGTG_11975 [Puccinia graminis f. sp. tritici CRL 75-36-700-3]KAA1101300.1 hypothetical protein PGT21_016027 [Puccinia graminis f. sp. tritici]KAA1126102.1 hypothetical protein PGTUg99_024092 [Puccinia graminis f. sp. tritici]